MTEKDQLFAGDPDQCSGNALDGAWFTVQSDNLRLDIEIHVFGTIPVPGGAGLPGYIFKEHGSDISLCNASASYAFQERLSPTQNHKSATWRYLMGEEAHAAAAGSMDLAIVFRGEVHGEDLRTLAHSQQPGWFNIACLRDALAKIDTDAIEPHDHAPIDDPNYYHRRTAALKMVTAYYCDRRDNPRDSARYTYEGNEIEFEFKNFDGTWRSRGGPVNKKVEAVWDENGALCLEHTRLYYKSHPKPIPTTALPRACQDGHCSEDQVLEELRRECPKLEREWRCDETRKTDGYFRSHPH